MNKKLIRLTESDLHRIVKESVNKILNEIGDTERGQYALGAVQARAQNRASNALQAGDMNAYGKYDNTEKDAMNAGFEHRRSGSQDANYDKRKALYNANQRGFRNYMSTINHGEDYRTQPQTSQELQQRRMQGGV